MPNAPENNSDKLEKSLGDQATDADVSHVDRERSLGDEVTVEETPPSPQPQEGFGGDLKSLGDLVDFEKRFQRERELGQGGMGAVLLATDRRLKRKVAIKRIRHELGQSEKIIERFFTEAKSVAALNHSNIAQIYEMEQDTVGPYLVMEYVQGGSLLDKLKSGPLDPATAVEIVCKVCEALSVLHHEGIVHRDIKPSNILLTLDGQPKLIDFGLARQDVADHSQTRTGAVLGTMDFMPPEQQRDATAVDGRSDLWSLAATLYQLITGEAPRPIYLENIPENLRNTLTTALKQNPAERFQTAEEFKRALQKETGTATVSVRPEMADDVCPSCDTVVEAGWPFCRGCGKLLFTKCLSCGNRMPVWDECCRECGCKQADQAAATQAAAAEFAAAKAAAAQAAAAQYAAAQAAAAEFAAAKAAAAQAAAEQVARIRAANRKKNVQELLEGVNSPNTYIKGFGQRVAALGKLAASRAAEEKDTYEKEAAARAATRASAEKIVMTRPHVGMVYSVAFSPDGKRIVSGGSDKKVKVWDSETGVKVWDSEIGQQLLRFPRGRGISSVSFNPDGSRIVSGIGGAIWLWDASRGEELLTLEGPKRIVHSVTFSPDGTRIASGSADQTIRLWDNGTGQEIITLKGHSSTVESVCFSPDGKQIVSGSADNTLKVWDTGTGQEIITLKGHSKRVMSVSFSPDGKRIVSGSVDETVKVWDAQTGQEKLTLKGHSSTVASVCFSPDGSRIGSGSWDETVKVWDSETGLEIDILVGHTSSVFSVHFSPDGKRIVSGSGDGTLKVWNIELSD